ncbi:hypothetical protein PUN28_011062 [Cardiocondyla obscurior]|uniref:Uncharacterized protein n=1 Tax=Cardiocondyla obscurior TaxID=286306 RepID=A0AAW2FJ19_9HYME
MLSVTTEILLRPSQLNFLSASLIISEETFLKYQYDPFKDCAKSPIYRSAISHIETAIFRVATIQETVTSILMISSTREILPHLLTRRFSSSPPRFSPRKTNVSRTIIYLQTLPIFPSILNATRLAFEQTFMYFFLCDFTTYSSSYDYRTLVIFGGWLLSRFLTKHAGHFPVRFWILTRGFRAHKFVRRAASVTINMRLFHPRASPSPVYNDHHVAKYTRYWRKTAWESGKHKAGICLYDVVSAKWDRKIKIRETRSESAMRSSIQALLCYHLFYLFHYLLSLSLFFFFFQFLFYLFTFLRHNFEKQSKEQIKKEQIRGGGDISKSLKTFFFPPRESRLKTVRRTRDDVNYQSARHAITPFNNKPRIETVKKKGKEKKIYIAAYNKNKRDGLSEENESRSLIKLTEIK